MLTFLYLLNGLLMIALPLGLGIFLSRKLGTAWRLFGVGMVTFILSQVFHLPFNFLILNPGMERLGLDFDIPLDLAVIAVLAGLSAGVFEEVARYLTYRFWLKSDSDRTWRSALMFGAGHGGVEAIILGVLALFAFVTFVALRDDSVMALLSAEQAEIVQENLTAYWSAPWYTALLGAVERAAALCVHISATVMVLQVFRRRRLYWLLLAILWHATIDGVAVFAGTTWGIYVTEGIVVALGLVGVGIIFLLRDPAENPESDAPPSGSAAAPEIEIQPPSPENLEDSRYV
jgi:uncharacterized membrane protein YhfC